MTPEEREKKIAELMKSSGLSLESATLAIAIEAGDLPGDVIVEDDPTPPK